MKGEAWEAECLAEDPFAGDFGGSGDSDRILSDKMVTARKEGPCHYCVGRVEAGSRARRRVEVYDGELMRFGWCEGCCRAMAVYGEDPDLLESRSRDASALPEAKP